LPPAELSKVTANMNLDTLKKQLFAEGYGDLVHDLRPRGLMISDLHLKTTDGLFTVAWTERGEVTDLLHASKREEAACRCFYDVVSEQAWHFRTCRDAGEADALTMKLQYAGLNVRRNDIPNFNGPGDARYRIFLAGRDLQRAMRLASG
jgi:hypothetical protein